MLHIPVLVDSGDECHCLAARAESPFHRQIHDVHRIEDPCPQFTARSQKPEIVIGLSSQFSFGRKRARQRLLRRPKQSSRVRAQILPRRLSRVTCRTGFHSGVRRGCSETGSRQEAGDPCHTHRRASSRAPIAGPWRGSMSLVCGSLSRPRRKCCRTALLWNTPPIWATFTVSDGANSRRRTTPVIVSKSRAAS